MPAESPRPEERLARQAEELEELREFVDETAFGEDQRDARSTICPLGESWEKGRRTWRYTDEISPVTPSRCAMR
jgi:hypothetical protein